MPSWKKGGFTFKQFFVAHDQSPQKVTTDSCLLGAWAPINPDIKRVLDIGTGCGVLALMLAQRLAQQYVEIDAVDIDCQAIEQCNDNIHQSPFNNINAYQCDINQFKANTIGYYDLIITNPPYFASANNCRTQQRQQARYTESLNFQQLLTIVQRLLNSDGKFCLVLPYHLADLFKLLAQQNQFFLIKSLDIRYTITKPYSLTLLCFSRQDQSVNQSQLYLREVDGQYSNDFKQLLKEFYLFRSAKTD